MPSLGAAKDWLLAAWAATPCFLYRWQTLTAGLLAFGGALWTVRSIRRQIRQTQDLERERRLSDERAAKVALPLALSALVQYSLDCIQLVTRHIPGGGLVQPVTPDLVAPPIPDSVIGTLQAIARNADQTVAHHTATVLGKLQIQHSRLIGLISRTARDAPAPMSIPEGEDAVYDAADLYVFLVRMFAYARDIEGVRQHASAAELKTAHS